MEFAQTFWQFRDTELNLSDVDRFIGATEHRWEVGTILRFVCRRATRDAKKKAREVNLRGRVTVIIEEKG